eukprot:CAMPEP_0183743194 /NCGR_PEP_ID=MMETSP0737-20130205/65092_1 /TAXON_ID=385413 /ORGANISM="Thalassiosira miniscula, Strain CCMP1093" /LENGTH=256 /DNA_ID=CAMNT_0025978803 /DNA_START=791 /DNA_END=1561 /DNA_ORIENTATION=+
MSSNHPASQFLSLWQSGACDSDAHSRLDTILSQCPLSGRVIHGRVGVQGFGSLLSADRWKRLSWVFGPEALHQFLRKSSREICILLGFGEEWLDAKLARGVEFEVAVFPSASVAAKLANWEGVQQLLEHHYKKVWTTKISIHWKQIVNTAFEDIEKMAGYKMLTVNLVGRYDHDTGESNDERYISLQRLLKREGTMVEVRQFLWDEIGLKGNYTGTGFTKDDNGNSGPPEYLARNMPLKDIVGIAIANVVPAPGNS